MNPFRFHKTLWAVLAASLALAPTARAHFLWVTVEPGVAPGPATIRAFFNEEPEPDAAFTKYIRGVRLLVDGQTVPSEVGEASRAGLWAGRRPAIVDSELDLGVTARGATRFHLWYTARAQTKPIPADVQEVARGLRVRLVEAADKNRVQVLFDGKPVANARVKVYPAEGDPHELSTDDQGQASVPGISEGESALWATRVDPTPGVLEGKEFAETRHYATLTFTPVAATLAEHATAFATMPAPAVTSLGAAVLGKYLYVYGGHVGRTHQYNVDTTSRHFRRLNLEDRATWEELPMGRDLQGLALVSDVQGLALVSDGKALYRVGGMAARNKSDEEQDMHSVAEFARFDPETKKWTDLPPMPEARSTHDAAVIGRTLYVVGGWTMKGASEESTFLDHALAFELDRPSAGWRTIPQPFRRRALAAAAHAGKLYVLGGLVDDGMKVERRVDVFDPVKATWARGPELPAAGRTEGFGSSAYELDGHLFVSGASGRIFRLGEAWEAVGEWSLPRITHRLLAAPDHTLLVVGGNAKGQPTPMIEAVRLGPSTVLTSGSAAAGE